MRIDLRKVTISKILKMADFDRKAHIHYLKECLQTLPSAYTSVESTMISILYFIVVGLDLLGELESVDKEAIVDRVYSLQLKPNAEFQCRYGCCGFLGSHCMSQRMSGNNLREYTESDNQEMGHIAMTYTAIAILITLQDDLTRLDHPSIIQGITRIFLVAIPW